MGYLQAMPIYEYQCSKCEHRLEALQKISDAPLSECPECKAPELKKLVSAASFRLKGGGWYETDFKTEGRKQLAESDSKPESASSGSSSSSSSDGGSSKSATKTASANAGSADKSAPKKPAKDTGKTND